MNIEIKRALCGCMAILMMAGMSGCAGSTDNAESEAQTETDVSETEGTKESIVTTRAREDIPTEAVSETLSGFDLSEVESGDVPADFEFSAEGEDGDLVDGATTMDKPFVGDFTGKGFAVVTEGSSVEFEIDFPAEGSYDVNVRAASDIENGEAAITVDGAALTSFDIAQTEFSDNQASKVLFGKGKHKLGFKTNSQVPIYIDNFTVKAAEKVDESIFEVKRELSNPNASDEAKRLYNFLCDSYGKYIISGQYAMNNMGTLSPEFSSIEENFGDFPAIMGLDLIELSPSRHNADTGYMAIRMAKDWWIEHGGIVTYCWHWNAPEKYLYQNDSKHPVWSGFYTEHTTINLKKIMDGEDKEGYDLLVKDIDTIAEYLKELQDYHVPVLWRPLHEGGGDPEWHNTWFWWGSSGGEAYIELWKLMYDRFTNYHGLNNLIWVWNGQNPEYYPGDEYVDIIGYDVYADAGDYSSKKWFFDFTRDCASENKIVAMTENGTLFDPDSAMNDGTRWSWFATWNGEFTLSEGKLPGEYTSMDIWEKLYTNDKVLTVSELPDLKNYPLDTEKYLEEHPDEK